jgi:hypothetical protein
MALTNDEVNAKASEIADKIRNAAQVGQNPQDLWNLTFGHVKVLVLELTGPEASSADECDHVFAGPAGFKDAPCLKCGVLWSVAETEVAK